MLVTCKKVNRYTTKRNNLLIQTKTGMCVISCWVCVWVCGLYSNLTSQIFINSNPVWSKFKMFGKYMYLETPAWRIVRSIRVVQFILVWIWNPPYKEQLLRFTFFKIKKSFKGLLFLNVICMKILKNEKFDLLLNYYFSVETFAVLTKL